MSHKPCRKPCRISHVASKPSHTHVAHTTKAPSVIIHLIAPKCSFDLSPCLLTLRISRQSCRFDAALTGSWSRRSLWVRRRRRKGQEGGGKAGEGNEMVVSHQHSTCQQHMPLSQQQDTALCHEPALSFSGVQYTHVYVQVLFSCEI